MKLAPLPLVVLLALVSWASGQITEGQWTYVIENGGASITNSTATGDVTIPSELGGYPVTSIRGGAFFDYPELTSVSIPDSVTSIGGGAFQSCTGLTSVTFGNSVTSIGAEAFQSCTGLTSVTFGNSVVLTVGSSAFAECPLVGTITLPILATLSASAFPNGVTITRSSASLVTLIANEIVAALPNNYGIATKADLSGAIAGATTQAIAQVQASPNDYNLFSSTQYQANRITGVAEGKAEVTSNPTAYSLYTPATIMDLRMGGLMIQKQGTDATIVFQPQTTTDLVTLPFTNNGPPITNTVPMPGDKGFLRVGAIYVPANDLTDVQTDDAVVDSLLGDSPPSGN